MTLEAKTVQISSQWSPGSRTLSEVETTGRFNTESRPLLPALFLFLSLPPAKGKETAEILRALSD